MFYEFVRKLTVPFEKIEEAAPEKGRFLDVGCGHGLFAKLLVEKSKQRQILGIDPSTKKIEAANKNNSYQNIEFKAAYLEDIKEKFDCISIIDVLYLFPKEEKIKFLRYCRQLLNPGGKLILVGNGHGKQLVFKLLKIQETIMSKLLKFTHTDYGGLHFMSKENYSKILQEEGFKIESESDLKSVIPYPHFLLVAKISNSNDKQ